MKLVEHKNPNSLFEAFRLSTGPTSNFDIPMIRVLGFVDLGGETYHYISLKNYREHPQAWEFRTPEQRRSFFGTATVPLEKTDFILSVLSPPPPTISREEFDRGMAASGLPNWVIVNLTRDAEKSGLFDEAWI